MKFNLTKSKKIIKTVPVVALVSLFGGFFMLIFAIFLRRKRKRDTNIPASPAGGRIHPNDTNKK